MERGRTWWCSVRAGRRGYGLEGMGTSWKARVRAVAMARRAGDDAQCEARHVDTAFYPIRVESALPRPMGHRYKPPLPRWRANVPEIL